VVEEERVNAEGERGEAANTSGPQVHRAIVMFLEEFAVVHFEASWSLGTVEFCPLQTETMH
jgi:hypothetical protein